LKKKERMGGQPRNKGGVGSETDVDRKKGVKLISDVGNTGNQRIKGGGNGPKKRRANAGGEITILNKTDSQQFNRCGNEKNNVVENQTERKQGKGRGSGINPMDRR